MKKLAIPALLATLLPSSAFACMHMMNVQTNPADYMIYGVTISTLTLILFGHKIIESRRFMVSGTVLCGLLTGYILGIFLATEVHYFEWGGFSVAAGFFSLLVLSFSKIKRNWLRNLVLSGVFLVSLATSLALAGEQDMAENNVDQWNQPYQDVTF